MSTSKKTCKEVSNTIMDSLLERSKTHSTFGFDDALVAMQKGHAIKRIGWLGYWCWNPLMDKIDIHNWDGTVEHIDVDTAGSKPLVTLANIMAFDWMALTADELDMHNRVHAAMHQALANCECTKTDCFTCKCKTTKTKRTISKKSKCTKK